MNKPPFDPNQPFNVVDHTAKPPFDPNQHFVEVPSNEDQSSIGQNASDFGHAVVHGATMGGEDELAGGIQAALQAGQGTLHNMFPSMFDQSSRQQDQALVEQGFTGDLQPNLSDIYRSTQQQEAKNYNQIQERSPKLSTAGELTGGVASALAMNTLLPGGGMMLEEGNILGQGGMNAAKEIGKRAINAAPLGAAYGALESQGKLIASTPEERSQLLSDTAHGAATGSALAAGLSLGSQVAAPYVKQGAQSLLSKVGTAVDDSPLLRQITKAYQTGKQGLGFTGDANTSRVLSENKNVAEQTTQDLYNVKNKLGGRIDDTLKQAGDEGVVVGQSKASLNDFQDVMESGQGQLGRNFLQQNGKLITKFYNQGLSPEEANELRNAFKQLSYDKYEINPDLSEKAAQFSKSLYDDIENSMGDSLKALNKQYSGFVQAGPETILNKGATQQNSQRYLSDTNRGRNKIYQGINDLVDSSSKTNATADTAKQTLNSLVDNLSKYEQQNPGLLESLGFDKNTLIKRIKDQSDISQISSTIRGNHGDVGLQKNLIGGLIGKGTLGGANVAGQAVNTVSGVGKALGKPATILTDLSKGLYNATDEQLTRAAEALGASNPQNQTMGKALMEAIQNNDSIKRNAIIFTIMQNPASRQLLTEGAGTSNPGK